MNEIMFIYVTITKKASMNLRGSKSGETWEGWREKKEGEKLCNYILNSKNKIKK